MTTLLDVSDLHKSFTVSVGFFRTRRHEVLKGVSLHVNAGEVVGLVGESGSGKTTLIRSIMGMQLPDRGSVRFCDAELTKLTAAALRERRRDMAIVYQNPFLSLNPRLSVFTLIAEPIIHHETLSRDNLRDRVHDLLGKVGLNEDFAARHAGELSGGQAQRVAIARALALKPKLILLDEPTSALDVSVQAQVLNLLCDLQREENYAYLIVSHNLDVIRHVCDRVYVIEKGCFVEEGPVPDVMERPSHSYTKTLIGATPFL
jgi:ABC-type glutathione transport system ATPase component